MDTTVKLDSERYIIIDSNGLHLLEYQKNNVLSTQIDYTSIVSVEKNKIIYYDNYLNLDIMEDSDIVELKFKFDLQKKYIDYINIKNEVWISKNRHKHRISDLYVTSLSDSSKARHFIFYEDYFREICYSYNFNFELYSVKKFGYERVISFDEKSITIKGIDGIDTVYLFEDGNYEVVLDLLRFEL